MTGVGIGLEAEQKYFFAHLSLGADDTNEFISSARGLTLQAGGYSRALDSISWNLDLGISANQFSFSK